jgi:hypothetical protein
LTNKLHESSAFNPYLLSVCLSVSIVFRWPECLFSCCRARRTSQRHVANRMHALLCAEAKMHMALMVTRELHTAVHGGVAACVGGWASARAAVFAACGALALLTTRRLHCCLHFNAAWA